MKDKNNQNKEKREIKNNTSRNDYRKTSKNGRVAVNKGGSDPSWKNFDNKDNEN